MASQVYSEGYGLDREIVVRSPVETRGLSNVQTFQIGSGVQVPYSVAIEDSFHLKTKRPERQADHSHLYSEQIQEGMGLRFRFGLLCTRTFPKAESLSCLELTTIRTALTFFRNSTFQLKSYNTWNGQPQQTVK